jgi:molybdenum cofactor cytidylyltransferase
MPLASQTVVYIMSAGQGRRLGGLCKGRILVDGLALAARQIDLMQASGIRRVVIVVGHESDKIRAIVRQRAEHWRTLGSEIAVECIDAPSADSPTSPAPDLQESIAFALSHAQQLLNTEPQVSGILISLVDLPLLSREDICAVLGACDSAWVGARLPTSMQGQPGHPIWLSRNWVMQLCPASPGFSLRDLLQGPTAQASLLVERIKTASLGHFTDIDTPACIATLQAHHGLTISVRVSQ